MQKVEAHVQSGSVWFRVDGRATIPLSIVDVVKRLEWARLHSAKVGLGTLVELSAPSGAAA